MMKSKVMFQLAYCILSVMKFSVIVQDQADQYLSVPASKLRLFGITCQIKV